MGSNPLDYNVLNLRRQAGKLIDVVLLIDECEFPAHKVSQIQIKLLMYNICTYEYEYILFR